MEQILNRIRISWFRRTIFAVNIDVLYENEGIIIVNCLIFCWGGVLGADFNHITTHGSMIIELALEICIST